MDIILLLNYSYVYTFIVYTLHTIYVLCILGIHITQNVLKYYNIIYYV